MSALLVFTPALLAGMLLVHFLWPNMGWWSLILKASLGIGFGLGINSILYFLYLLAFPGRGGADYVALLPLACLLAITLIRRRQRFAVPSLSASRWQLSRAQIALIVATGLVLLTALLSTASYLLRRRQGDWDAWMMYNRAARFLYFDPTNWRQSFSPQMDPIFHPDYPLLLAMNITSSWESLGRDTAAVPMFQSVLFALGCVGLLAGALGATKSGGQAAVGAIFLWGTPVFVNEGARQMADVPMAFFVLATGALLHLYALQPRAGLLVMAGLGAGLAAWTKNEGAVSVLGAAAAVVLILARRYSWKTLMYFAVGLAAPLAVVLYFKLTLAPPGDIVSAATGGSIAQVLDPSRHALILSSMWTELKTFGSWGIPRITVGVLPILAVYYLVFRAPVPPQARSGLAACGIILLVQLAGYYLAYLISPYGLSWHLAYSSSRIVVQILPLLIFLVLNASREAEAVLAPGTANVRE